MVTLKAKIENEVGILVEELREKPMEFRKISDRVMTVKLVIRVLGLNIISAYAPQVYLDKDVKRHF